MHGPVGLWAAATRRRGDGCGRLLNTMLSAAFLDLIPMPSADGAVRLPGSKSISNRVLLLAGLSVGTTVLHDLLDSDDTQVMLSALQALGCGITREGHTCHVTGLGLGPDTAPPVNAAQLFMGNAGTAMRPLTAVLALLAARHGGCFELSGVARMHERPIGDLVAALRQIGCTIDELGAPGFPPLRLRGNGQAPDTAQPIRVRGDVSSQFLTALLMALPLVSGPDPITIEVEGPLISRPYINITLHLLARFGVSVDSHQGSHFTIPPHSRYQSPGPWHVEADASSASYFIALGAIAAHSGRAIRIDGVGLDSIQGDIRFIDAARAMGADVQGGPGHLEVRRGQWPLQAIQLDCTHIPDAAMTLAVMALYAQGRTHLSGIASWRVKETDRLSAMATELTKLGAQVVQGQDSLTITAPTQWQAASIHTYDDHRIAMCFSLAALHSVPVRIQDPRCVAKTFPDYFETLFSVAQVAPEDIPVITIDGPSASGKGTLASAVADALGYHFLDSGALYRATALAALQTGVDADDADALTAVAGQLKLRFKDHRIWLGDHEVSDLLRQEHIGALASRVSAHPGVRQALLALQLSHRRLPGLVADGRDMGTVIFPGAQLKVFVTARSEIRAQRRLQQLISKGIPANIADLLDELKKRDTRDQSRSVSPLKPAPDAKLLDSSDLCVNDCVETVLGWWQLQQAILV
jgi:3-phosphoshikimate 1-carboxyvinyltransferase